VQDNSRAVKAGFSRRFRFQPRTDLDGRLMGAVLEDFEWLSGDD
jgi:hypothetical protein